MKHILTTTAILLATSSALHAEGTLSDAIDSYVTPYLEAQETNGLSVDPEAVVSLATEATIEWNEGHESETILANAELQMELTTATADLANAKASFADAEMHLAAANNMIATLEGQIEVADNNVTILAAKVTSLTDDVNMLHKDLSNTNTILDQKLFELDNAEGELASTTKLLQDTESMLDLVVTQRDKAVEDYVASQANLLASQKTVDALHSELNIKEAQYNHLQSQVIIADAKGYVKMGDVLQSSKDNGTYSGNSYDVGKITSSVKPTGLYVKDYTEVTNINIKGKYSEFNIDTDIRLSKNSGNLAEFRSVIAEVKNVMYNEGYKDGYNDGFEDGYNVGYTDAVSDIKGE